MRFLRIGFWLALTLAAMFCCSPRAFAQLRVSPSGPPLGDGSSWSNPLPSSRLQEMIDGGATSIWLMQGNYPAISLRAGTTIQGGYAGDIHDDKRRDPDTYRTFLNGVRLSPYWQRPDGSIVDGHHAPLTQYPSGATRVDGCTIYAGASGCSVFATGARNGVPTLDNCVLEGSGNTVGVWSAGAAIDDGGSGYGEPSGVLLVRCTIKNQGLVGARVSDMGRLELRDCSVTNNRLGILSIAGVFGLSHSEPTLTVTDCVVRDNGLSASGDSLLGLGFHFGGIEIHGEQLALINRCELRNNVGLGTGGGLALWASGLNGKIAVRDCVIAGNIGKEAGSAGGIYCGWDDDSRPHALSPDAIAVSDCTITQNRISAQGMSESQRQRFGGAGLYINTAGVQLTRCTINRNYSEASGGGLHLRAGNDAADGSGFGPPTSIRACVIADNTAERRGGGMYLDSSAPRFWNCTIANNTAPEGGAVYAVAAQISSASSPRPASAQFANCAVLGNTATYGSVLLWQRSDFSLPPPSFVRCAYGPADTWQVHFFPTLDSVSNLTPPVSGGSFTVASPGFVNAAGNDYRLAAESPLLDRGDNALVATGDTDRDNSARIVNSLVDIGAYERSVGPPRVVINTAAARSGNPIVVTVRLKNTGAAPATNIQINSVSAKTSTGQPYTILGYEFVNADPSGALGIGESVDVRIRLEPITGVPPFVVLNFAGRYTGGAFTLNRVLQTL